MQSPQGRAPFQAAGPHQARPMAGQAISVGTPKESRVRAAADVDREARAASEVLRNMLKTQFPWTREIELQRQKTRNFYLTLIFAHPLSTYAQSLDGLWHHSTYTLIASFRELISRTESSLSLTHPAGPRKTKSQNSPAQIELRKVLTRFRQALASEEGFYRGLVSRIVAFYQLQSVAREYLGSVGVGIAVGDGVEGGAPAMGAEEKREKVGLVYKGLICVGDLERYREQYSDRGRRERKGGREREGRGEERFGTAKMYYEVARGLQPDDGSAFNQLAVISTYVNDDLLCVYYYFRAMAVRQAFKNIEDILEKFLTKVYERWHTAQGDDDEDRDGETGLEELRRDFLVIIAILYRRTGTSQMAMLKPKTLDRFADLLRTRALPSETIVKLTAISIGCHWHARQNASIAPSESDAKRAKRRHDTEHIALDFVLAFFGMLIQTAVEELDEISLSNPLGDLDLHQHISAVLRRLLPALRIASKWIKLHLEYISRYLSTSNESLVTQIQSFWTRYKRLTSIFARLFPIAQLPTLTDKLEEDIDMRGFVPLSRGMSAPDSYDKEANGHREAAHPNEEQLMRIADLQVDAQLLIQSEAGLRAMNGNASAIVTSPLTSPSSFMTRRDADDGDIASVSTETEDDPVNLAMRATLGGSSTDQEEQGRVDDEDEVIVWDKGSHTPVNVHGGTASPANAPTAYDLLQNLMVDTSPASPALRAIVPGQPSPRSGLLFGGELGGASIWTMTREESEMGTKRAPRGSAGNLANFKSLWDDPATGSASADVSMTAANMPPSASQQTPRSFHNYPNGGNPTGNAPAHIAWPAYNTLEGYHQYYEPQSSPYGAQWAQAYHPT